MQRKKGIVKISYLCNSAKPCKHWIKRRIRKRYRCTCIHKITDYLKNRQFNAPICRNHEIFRIRQKMIYINLRCYERKKKQKRDLKPTTSKEEQQFTTHIWLYVSRLIEYLYVQGWCVCRRFRVLWIGLGFLLKAMVFTFTLEKNHLKCQFSNEGNQCALSPSDSSVWKHASTCIII